MKLRKSKSKSVNAEKIVVLNSGGFDSVILAHEVAFQNPDSEIINLFFDYGQLSCEAERKCAFKCAEKLNQMVYEITLPNFDWGDSVLTGGDNPSQYIPLRNLIFLSYALSYAQGIGATKVYCAFTNPLDEYYQDTSPIFVEKMNELSALFNIKIEAPFIHETKGYILKSLARQYGIYPEDVHSCNYGNEPCGKCPDCLALEEIFKEVQNKEPEDILIDNKFEVSEEMIESIKKQKITTAKVYINNSCQFSCSHCFIGNKQLYQDPLSKEEWINLFKAMKKYGITHVDFFGKEPLYDESIFSYIEECQRLGITFSLITNGVNVKKYINQLSTFKPTMAISVEKLEQDTNYRNSGNFVADAIKLLVKNKIPTNVSIDLSYSNLDELIPLIKKLSKMGVNNIYIKPLRPFGSSEDELMESMLESEDILKAVHDVSALCMNNYKGSPITFSFSAMDLSRMYEDCPDEFNEILGYAIQNRLNEVDGVFFEFELFCHRFMNSISITPDGYVLGCASEYCTNYQHRYNSVRHGSLEDCIQKYKQSLNFKDYSTVGCYFCKQYKKIGKKIFEIG